LNPATFTGLCGIAIFSFASSVAAQQAQRMDVLDSVELPTQSSDGTGISELSGLGWDQDAGLLYAVSDNGYLHHFKIVIDGDKIKTVDPVFATEIADSSGGLLSWSLTNAEGLHVRNGDNGNPADAELLIAFEDGPAIGRFTPKGDFIAEVSLPQPISDASAYSSSNKRLESVTEHPDLGELSAPEAHLANEPEDVHSIFALDGRKWLIPARQPQQDSIKALDVLPNGRLLMLDRTRNDAGDTQAHFSLFDIAHCAAGTTCPVTEVPVSVPAELAEDFEGMTRISADEFLIVTDSPKGGTLVLMKLAL
jgi:Esterase-like activity of phytase